MMNGSENVAGLSFKRIHSFKEKMSTDLSSDKNSSVKHRLHHKDSSNAANEGISSHSNHGPGSPKQEETVRRKSTLTYGRMGGVTYSWENLNVYADEKSFFGKVKSTTHILKNVSGVCKPGQLLAIMGASGAGKTTLLNVLTFRSIDLRVEGDIRLNGHKADPNTLMGVSAYVQQLDLFTRVFTVREQLEFHAQLRVGKKVSARERKDRIEEVLIELGMTKCADTLIGEPGRIKGISGGEKKRLAFACELITNPLLLLCDEPTSGIDSFMALSVMKAMKKMTLLGKTVVSTIHQPNSEVFSLFDRLLILSEGRVAFLGTVEQAHSFFYRIERPCPDNYNPGDHFIYTMAIKAGKEEECKEYINKVCDNFRDNEGISMMQQVKEARSPPSENDVLSNLQIPKSPYRASYMNQFMALLRRSVLEVLREPALTAVKFFQILFFSLVFGLIYLDQDPTTHDGVMNIFGVLFIFVTNLSFSQLFPVVTVFAGEMPLFLREHWNGMYRSDVYFLTRNLIELPIYIVIPMLFISVNYYMVGLRAGAEYFFTAMLILVLVGNCAVSFGYMVSCLADDYNTALVISTPLTFPLMLFGGFYMQADSIPKYIGWLKYFSWFMYGFESLSINQWDGFEVTNEITNVTIPVGNLALEKLSFEPDNLKIDIWAIFALAIFYRLIAYLLLFVKTLKKRN